MISSGSYPMRSFAPRFHDATFPCGSSMMSTQSFSEATSRRARSVSLASRYCSASTDMAPSKNPTIDVSALARRAGVFP